MNCMCVQYIQDMKTAVISHPHPQPQPVSVPEAKVWLEMCSWTVRAGFPSPAADHTRKRIDLNEHLIRNKEATFIFRVKGDSMNGIGIYEGDELLVDRSIEAKHGNIVLAVLNNDYTVKRLYRRGGVVKLIAENPLYPPIVVRDGQELVIWGVVTRNLHKLY
jgi:DNA polymerase V